MNYKECFSCRKNIPLSHKGVYCDECRRKIYAYKEESYSVKTETSKIYRKNAWRKARNEALKRSGYRCEVCEAKGIIEEAVEVHHIIKVKDGDNSTNYDLENLVAVCAKCHRIIEDMALKDLINYLEST